MTKKGKKFTNKQEFYEPFCNRNTYCAVERMPREDWERAMRKNYPDIFNFSQILSNSVEMKPERDSLLGYKPLVERRHFSGLSTKSYLDDYY